MSTAEKESNMGWDPTSDSADFEASADLGWQLALGAAQDNVEELLVGRHRRNVLPGCLHGGQRGLRVPGSDRGWVGAAMGVVAGCLLGGVAEGREDLEEVGGDGRCGRSKGEGGQFFFCARRWESLAEALSIRSFHCGPRRVYLVWLYHILPIWVWEYLCPSSRPHQPRHRIVVGALRSLEGQ